MLFSGKFGQRPDNTQCKLFSDPEEYFAVLTDPENECTAAEPLTDSVVMLSYRKRSEFVPVLLNTNAVLASFVAAYGRLKLYSYMQPLGAKLLYGDTDSVVFSWDTTRDVSIY